VKNLFRRTPLLEVTLNNGTKIRFRVKDFSFDSHTTRWVSVGNRKRLVYLPPDKIAAVVRIK
jgi:hypothetical protein